MDPSTLTPEKLLFFFNIEFERNDRKWAASELRLLARARAEMPERYQHYLASFSPYLPPDPNSSTGFAISGLTIAQKALQLFVLDVFADFMITTYRSPFEEWLGYWEKNCLPMAKAAYETMITRPEIVQTNDIEVAWNELRAAIS